MCKGQHVVLVLPDYIDPGKENRTITCDACIQEVIKFLWNVEWQTRGCCCGHGERNPSIVIPEGYTDLDALKLKRLLQSIDPRTWDVYQWRLTKV